VEARDDFDEGIVTWSDSVVLEGMSALSLSSRSRAPASSPSKRMVACIEEDAKKEKRKRGLRGGVVKKKKKKKKKNNVV
jgi:hypothetical protein